MLKKTYPVVFITAAVVIAVSLLAFTASFAQVQIEVQEDAQTLELLANVFPEAAYYNYDQETEIYTVYDSNKSQIGYAFYAEGMGEGIQDTEGGSKIAGPIIILVGLEDKDTIKGIFVISHWETEFFWGLVIKANYFDQFKGLKIEDAYLRKAGGKVDGVLSATLSSNLVLNTVREAAIEKSQLIK